MGCGMTLPAGIELRCGDWRDALADVEMVDCLCSDPPYGQRTHEGQRHGRFDKVEPNCVDYKLSSRGLGYSAWTPGDVERFVSAWVPRIRGWFCAFASHDLVAAYQDHLEDMGFYAFAPISCVQHAMNVRLAGDGPSNWTTHLVVARPRTMRPWGALPGAYVGKSHDPGENALDRSKRAVAGAKPVWLMRAIIRDYTRPGDLVCDPCVGGGTTLLAAAIEGRRAIGAEINQKTYELAKRRLEAGFTPLLPGMAA